MHKTQVFINHEGDLFRTRLTHSLEVSQIARICARRLKLNEDLTEALCLSHDLGHTPFGHAGQFALNKVMKKIDPSSNGFEHNIQSLRIVDLLECKYAEFDGLNLCYETREGILKRCSKKAAHKLGGVAQRFIDGGYPSLEAQLSNLADEVAYNHHDLDDGLRAGLLSLEDVLHIPAAKDQAKIVDKLYPRLEEYRRQSEIIRRMISAQVDDLVFTSSNFLKQANIKSIDDVRAFSKPLIGFSSYMKENVTKLKIFLHDQMYKHPSVLEMTCVAEEVVKNLFFKMLDDSKEYDDTKRLRMIADSIAAMTDRHAASLHEHWFPRKVSWPSPVGFV
jgi:dGTPase